MKRCQGDNSFPPRRVGIFFFFKELLEVEWKESKEKALGIVVRCQEETAVPPPTRAQTRPHPHSSGPTPSCSSGEAASCLPRYK